MPQVAIFMGSISDEEKMRPCADILKDLGVSYLFTVSSAHRTPARTEKLVAELEADGCQVFICAAGLAAHLAGAVAAKTTRPVLGVPLSASSLGGMDALLATVQMPPGFPVGTLALDKVGARNAAWLAAQILALHDDGLAAKLKAKRQGFIEAVEKAAEGLTQ
ncbi:MAG: 5-(carboxyamino)imidazole ribonucleotide mutase [Proteobacteria bacterium]|nr:5-(carboxyamino)imidazole ribonucleotide mutase [Pseudomonadota bacterium]MBU1610580.1 5-(carboxyamino)imidazole ribonucleotide mutase [Pseudomonadota bacterium]